MDKEKILILGSGGHAKSVADTIERQGIFEITGFIEHSECEKKEYHGYRIIGTDDDLEKFFKAGIENAAIGIGYLGKGNIRNHLYKKLKMIGFKLPVICDPSAIIASDVRIAEGVFVGKRAVINTMSQVERIAIINTGAMIEHDCYIGGETHIAVGAVLCGGVSVGAGCFVGAGAVVIQGRIIGDYVCIGAGATVLGDIENKKIVYGIVKNKNYI